ncbi:glyoxalase [Lewinella sp. IMCC34191]|uniref:glyoxalase n=1 Tax=Lewinella sp. IMCC34191 TaxID=2259172 RepID=UPI000E22C26B|nr:glyoxalase [Lewinella sp. IMCC34191]
MQCLSKSIRAFIGAKDFSESRRFYRAMGFDEVVIDPKMSYFKVSRIIGFYLQDYYEKSWVDNSMLLLQVENFDDCYGELMGKDLPTAFPGVRFSDVKRHDWGRELDMLDPSGVLWHFAEFRGN